MILTNKEARKLLLYYHGLLQPKVYKGKDGIMDFVKRVGCLQFDPLNVIAMNPHLVLQSRIKNYKRKQLDELLYKDRLLMDGWDKCMSIYPITDRPYFKRYFDTAIETHTWRDKDIVSYIPEIREKIKTVGPVTSKDIALDHKIDWSWAPTSVARAVLDLMFFTGELTIYNKLGSRKVYDFSSNHMPQTILSAKEPHVKDLDYYKWGLLRRINACGFLWDKRSEALLGIKGMKTKERRDAFKALLEDGKVIKFNIENNDYDFYMATETAEMLPLLEKKFNRRVSFIAPLDSFIWDRPMIHALFDFKYKWEVYTPAIERVYGYYVLPILLGDEFIGRIEPRFDDKTNILTLHNIWLNSKIKNFEKPLMKAIKDFAKFLDAKTIVLDTNSKTYETLYALFPLEILNSK